MSQLGMAASQRLRLSDNQSIREQARSYITVPPLLMARLPANAFTCKCTLLVLNSVMRTNTRHLAAPFSITPASYVGNF
jgi:hypothetical protein